MPRQRPHRSKQDYQTPMNFIVAAKHRLKIRSFSFDFAADASNTKARRWWGESDNSLQKLPREWVHAARGGWGWLNPPFADIEPWAVACAQMQRAGGRVALLIPASVGSNWFVDYVHGEAQVLLLNGRLAFIPQHPKWLYPKDCVLALYAPRIRAVYDVWDWRAELLKKKAA